jgi:hypothetical protein
VVGPHGRSAIIRELVLPFLNRRYQFLVAVAPVSMCVKAAISPLPELAQEVGKAEAVGEAKAATCWLVDSRAQKIAPRFAAGLRRSTLPRDMSSEGDDVVPTSARRQHVPARRRPS